MRTSVWYRTEEKQPDKSGYYLSYRGWGIAGKADDDHDYGYVYYDKKKNEWRDYESMGHFAIVYYWTDATPDSWVDEDPSSVQLRGKVKHNVPAVQAAWEEAMKAIANYELIRNLAQ